MISHMERHHFDSEGVNTFCEIAEGSLITVPNIITSSLSHACFECYVRICVSLCPLRRLHIL